MGVQAFQLFGVPVYRAWVPQTPALKESFLPEILRRYEARHYTRMPGWDTDRVHTSFGAPASDQVIQNLPDAYAAFIRRFVRSGGYRTDLWHSVYWREREYDAIHNHLPSHYTLLHLLSSDPAEHRKPLFYDPAKNVKAFSRHAAMPSEFWADWSSVEAYEQDILIFPSYLEYCIPPGDYAKPMITVTLTVTLDAPPREHHH